MNLFDVLALAAGNLWRRKLRTMLTVLGVIIGTACIVIMVALGLGNLEQFNENIMGSFNLTQIQVYNYGSMGGQSGTRLNEQTIDMIKGWDGVKSATGVQSLPAYLVMGKYVNGSEVYAVDAEAMGFEFMEGGLYSDTDAVELVIGKSTRQYFTDPRDTSGYYGYGVAMSVGGVYYEDAEYEEPSGPDVDWLTQQLKFYPHWSDGKDEEFTPENPAPKEYKAKITGILSNDAWSYQMFISRDAADRIMKENKKLLENLGYKAGSYQQAYVNAVDVDAVDGILTKIKEMGFEAYSDSEWINTVQEEAMRQQSQLIAIGLISLLVSAIGIANTMLASILERRREIGVMKVIGLSIRKINLMFLVEAALIGLLGGIIGLVISYAVGGVVNMGGGEMNFLGMYFYEGVRLSIPWWLSLGAILIATGVGIVSGLYPAWRATKMSPLEAIRGAE
ncbi:ABC transporter permease [Christensenellaceae bacterium OttesenSCG-928-K19]|nr:ABC transporter permease [Christensenellaceae bacterium OttesenSCG-928-K19]